LKIGIEGGRGRKAKERKTEETLLVRGKSEKGGLWRWGRTEGRETKGKGGK
jgi:hypothetical protein